MLKRFYYKPIVVRVWGCMLVVGVKVGLGVALGVGLGNDRTARQVGSKRKHGTLLLV